MRRESGEACWRWPAGAAGAALGRSIGEGEEMQRGEERVQSWRSRRVAPLEMSASARGVGSGIGDSPGDVLSDSSGRRRSVRRGRDGNCQGARCRDDSRSRSGGQKTSKQKCLSPALWSGSGRATPSLVGSPRIQVRSSTNSGPPFVLANAPNSSPPDGPEFGAFCRRALVRPRLGRPDFGAFCHRESPRSCQVISLVCLRAKSSLYCACPDALRMPGCVAYRKEHRNQVRRRT